MVCFGYPRDLPPDHRFFTTHHLPITHPREKIVNLHYREKVRTLFDRFRTGRGTTPLSQRQDVEHWAAQLAGAPLDDTIDPQPDALRSYLQKVALHAYKVTDRDVEQLKAAGCSEDEIFELTLSAALGASRARLDQGLTLLQAGGK